MIKLAEYRKILSDVSIHNAQLIAVSKTKPVEDIRLLMNEDQQDFGENYVQELLGKQALLPSLRWHFIGHLQSNKVKSIAPFIYLIHGVDSASLLEEINKQGAKINRKIDCLLQIFIATEESKFGLSESEAEELFEQEKLGKFPFINLRGLMGMASNTSNENKIRNEFKSLRRFFEKYKCESINILSMGMTGDYKIALEEGSTMVRIGSAIFGERTRH